MEVFYAAASFLTRMYCTTPSRRPCGSVFVKTAIEGRFKSFPVAEDDYFLTLCRYVEANALRAGLVEEVPPIKRKPDFRIPLRPQHVDMFSGRRSNGQRDCGVKTMNLPVSTLQLGVFAIDGTRRDKTPCVFRSSSCINRDFNDSCGKKRFPHFQMS